MTFGELLRARRKECGLSVVGLGGRIEVYPDLISRWERNIRVPSKGQIIKLMDALNLTGQEERYNFIMTWLQAGKKEEA
jgi:transcriptional regulator with XRE-family HTH domain